MIMIIVIYTIQCSVASAVAATFQLIHFVDVQSVRKQNGSFKSYMLSNLTHYQHHEPHR